MNMNFYVRFLPWAFATALLLGLSSKAHAQSTSDVLSFEDFAADQGWVFQANLTKAAGLDDLDGCPSAVAGGEAFSASTFSEQDFDPRDFSIPLSVDDTQPSNFRVGVQGVIQFHSAHRLEVLYTRYLMGLKAEKK
jgi:hypothetical protein